MRFQGQSVHAGSRRRFSTKPGRLHLRPKTHAYVATSCSWAAAHIRCLLTSCCPAPACAAAGAESPSWERNHWGSAVFRSRIRRLGLDDAPARCSRPLYRAAGPLQRAYRASFVGTPSVFASWFHRCKVTVVVTEVILPAIDAR